MSKVEELMLAKWQEINKELPPAEHLQSTLREQPSRMRIVREPVTQEPLRDKKILQLYAADYTPVDIAKSLRIRKSVVVEVLNSNRNSNVSMPLLKDINKDDMKFCMNSEDDDMEFPFILSYNGKKTKLRSRHYLIFKALLNHKEEWYPVKDLLDLYYRDKERPKTAQNCFRKQIKYVRLSIERVGLTVIIKPRYGYKLVRFID